MTRARVMPARKVPFASGVNTTPSLTMKILAVPISATLPSMSHIRQLSKPRARFDQGARIVRVETAGLGLDRRAFPRRAAERRQRDRITGRLRHRRHKKREAPARGIGVRLHQASRRALLGPIHRPNIECCSLIEPFDPLTYQVR